MLLASAIVLVVGSAASAAGIEWAALLAVLALVAAAPALRWSALAALVAVATVLERDAERPAWLAVGVVGLTPVLQALASPTWSARVQAVALGLGLVMMLFAARAGMLRVLVLPATTLLVMLFLPSLSPSNAVRFQWVAALGAALTNRGIAAVTVSEGAATIELSGSSDDHGGAPQPVPVTIRIGTGRQGRGEIAARGLATSDRADGTAR